MEIRTLKYFLEIAKTENMTSAARNLHVSQSALSRQMTDLEREIGKTLFIRTNRQTLLSEDGLHLARRAEEIIALVEKTEKEMHDEKDISGEIHIGAGETKGFSLLCEAMKRVQEKYPHISFSTYSGNATDISEKLEHGLLDFGLMFEPFSKERYQYIDFPYVNKLGLIVKSDHPLANQKSITEKEIRDIPLLVSSRLNDKKLFQELSNKEVEALKIKGTYNLIFNAILMVNQGIGSAIAIDGLINQDNNLRFLQFEPEINLKMYFVWKKNHIHTKASEILLEELQKIIQDARN